MVQSRRAIWRFAREDIVACRIQHTHMQMRAAARHVGVGLRQKGRLSAVVQCHALDESLQTNGFIAGAQGAVAMLQVHFHLPGAVFGQRTGGRYVLNCRYAIHFLKECGPIVKVGHGIDLRAVFTAPRTRRTGRLRVATGSTLLVH